MKLKNIKWLKEKFLKSKYNNYKNNLIENELNKKSNKKAHVRNDVITNVIVHCRGGKKGGERRRGEFRKKLKIPEYEISQCPEYKIKSKIGKIFVDKKALEEYCVKFYEIEFFLWALWRKIKVDKNGSKYILFRIDVYFSEYNLAVEVDEKRHTDRDLIFF